MPLLAIDVGHGDREARPATPKEIDEAVLMITSLVPPGRVVSYGAIARALGVHPRRVARALARNPRPIEVPCHRVVRSDGGVGGYTPAGPGFKERLLRLEGVEVVGGRVPKRFFADEELLAMLGCDVSGV